VHVEVSVWNNQESAGGQPLFVEKVRKVTRDLRFSVSVIIEREPKTFWDLIK